MVAFLHHEKTAEAMVSGVRQLKERLGDSFLDLASIILTDRGTEFTNADAMEELGAISSIVIRCVLVRNPMWKTIITYYVGFCRIKQISRRWDYGLRKIWI